MSDHVIDRLSAYRDGELTVADAALVRQHLGVCAQCAEELALLAAVDARLREVPVEAPPGYFDSFSTRVRGRIETAPPARRAFSLPAWSWAVAAALLLAVVLPRLPWDEAPRPESAPGTLPYPGPASAAVPAEAGAPTADTAAPEAAPSLSLSRKTQAHGVSQDTLQDAKRRDAASTPAPAQARDFAAPPPGAAEGTALRPEAKVEAELDAASSRVASDVEDTYAEKAERQQTAGASDEEEAPLELRLRKAERGKAGKSDAPAVPKAPAPGVVAQGRVADKENMSREVAAPSRAANMAEAPAEFQALRSRKAASLEERRALREAWRAFVRRHPAAPEAAEARVLIVGLGVDIAQRTGAAKDAEEARRDGTDALAHGDLQQQRRVQRLMDRREPQ